MGISPLGKDQAQVDGALALRDVSTLQQGPLRATPARATDCSKQISWHKQNKKHEWILVKKNLSAQSLRYHLRISRRLKKGV